MLVSEKELKLISEKEEVPSDLIKKEISCGRAVLLRNKKRKINPIIVGRKFKCKINVNIGISPESKSLKKELKKMYAAIECGANVLMDLSTGSDAFRTRSILLKNSNLPLGTVPIYSMPQINGRIQLSKSAILDEIEKQAEQGVDFMTLHCGILSRHLPLAKKRIVGIVSRGGALIAKYMSETGKENPFYEYFDEILPVLKKYSVTISLGDGLRPGSCHDASDAAQYAELSVLGELKKRCLSSGVGFMIEGPGHVPMNLIKENVLRAEKETDKAPLYFLGPLVVDNAMGRDHIAAAIGATMAGFYGVSLLCVVTPAEHIGLPDIEDIREGTCVFRIAAESVNLARGFNQEKMTSIEISKARVAFDWQKQFSLAIDGRLAKEKYQKLNRKKRNYCSMCGKDFCAMKKFKDCIEVL